MKKCIKKFWIECVLDKTVEKNKNSVEVKSGIQNEEFINTLTKEEIILIYNVGLDSLNYIRDSNRSLDEKYFRLMTILISFFTITVSVSSIIISNQSFIIRDFNTWHFILIIFYVILFILLLIRILQKVIPKTASTAISFDFFIEDIQKTLPALRVFQSIDELMKEEQKFHNKKKLCFRFIYFMTMILIILSFLIILSIAFI